MKRLLVPGIPFALSLTLSAFTVGTTVGWQDSGFFLTGVHDLGVLYPPGFVLYLLLCKSWTLILGFVDFTLAVHLFSSMCAALAAGTIAVAAWDLLRARGPIFNVGGGDSILIPVVTGSLAASAFTFWSAALLAKGYALFYLLLALLLWRMIRADGSGKGRDFTIVAVLIGLSWAAHPSATNLGLALVLFVAAHARTLGPKGIAWRAGVSAACAIGPSLLLPVLVARDPGTLLGHPAGFGEWLRYLFGSKFIHLPGVFGLDGFRVANAFKYLAQDLMVVGLALALFGLVKIAAANRKLLVGIAAWVVPSALIAILFRIEGQQDFWLVASWLPLHLAVAFGLRSLAPRLARIAVPALGVVGVASAVLWNSREVSMRGYDLAEKYGRFHLESMAADALLMLESDDALATAGYVQRLKGLRPDVVIVNAARFDASRAYESYLLRRNPRLVAGGTGTAAAFASANVSRGRPVYFESPPAEADLPAGFMLLPAGPLLKLVPRDGAVEPERWPLPVDPDAVRARTGRERGLRLRLRAGGLDVEPESYERRWIHAQARAALNEGHFYFKRGGDEDYRRAVERLEAARAADPGESTLELVEELGLAYYRTKRYDQAEPFLKQVLRPEATPRQWVRACSLLSAICRAQRREADAQRYHAQAMSVVGSDPELRRDFERFTAPR